METEASSASKVLCIGLASEWGTGASHPGIKRGTKFLSLLGIEDLYNRFVNTHAVIRCSKHHQLVHDQTASSRIDSLLEDACLKGFLLLVIPLDSLGEREQRQLLSALELRYLISDGLLKRREEVVLRTSKSLYGVLYSASAPPGDIARREMEGLLLKTAGFQHELMICDRSRKNLTSLGNLQLGMYCSDCKEPLQLNEIEPVLLWNGNEYSLQEMSIAQLVEYLAIHDRDSMLLKRLQLMIDCGFASYAVSHSSGLLSYQEQKIIMAYRLITLSLRGRTLHLDNLLAAIERKHRTRIYSRLQECMGVANELTLIDDTQSGDSGTVLQGVPPPSEIVPGQTFILRSVMGTGELEYRARLKRQFRKSKHSHILQSSSWLTRLPSTPFSVFGLKPLLVDYLNSTPFGKRYTVTIDDLNPERSRFQCSCSGAGCESCAGSGFDDSFRNLTIGSTILGHLWTEELQCWLHSLDFLPNFSHVFKVVEAFGLGQTKAQDSWYAVVAEERILYFLAQAFCIPRTAATRVLVDIGAELTRAMDKIVAQKVNRQLQKLPDHIAVVMVTRDELITSPDYIYIDVEL